jgi:hypothetical protein
LTDFFERNGFGRTAERSIVDDALDQDVVAMFLDGGEKSERAYLCQGAKWDLDISDNKAFSLAYKSLRAFWEF